MRLLPTCLCLILATSFNSVNANDMPMMVHSDAKRSLDQNRVSACSVMVTANGINGEYFSVIIELAQQADTPRLEYTVAAGNIDYNNGRELYDYVESAWLTTAGKSTKNLIDDSGRGPANDAYRASYGDPDAIAFYENIITKPFELTLVTAMHRQPYSHRFEQAYDDHVSKKAADCLQHFKTANN